MGEVDKVSGIKTRPKKSISQLILFLLGLSILTIFGFFFWESLTSKVYSLETGPFKLERNDFEGVYELTKSFPTPGSGWVEKMTVEVLGAPASVLHHLVVQYSGRKDLICPALHERFYAGSKERTPAALPRSFGYEIERSKNFYLTTHLTNPHTIPFENVKVKVSLFFRPKNPVIFNKKVRPIWLDFVSCNPDPSFSIPPKMAGEFHLNPKVLVPYNSKIVFAGAHVHDYGKNLKVFLDGAEIFNFVAETAGPQIIKMPTFSLKDKSVKLNKGQVLDMKSYYQNESENFIDGMGIAILAVVAE